MNPWNWFALWTINPSAILPVNVAVTPLFVSKKGVRVPAAILSKLKIESALTTVAEPASNMTPTMLVKSFLMKRPSKLPIDLR